MGKGILPVEGEPLGGPAGLRKRSGLRVCRRELARAALPISKKKLRALEAAGHPVYPPRNE